MTNLSDKLKEVLPKVLPFAAILVVGIGIGWGLKPTQVEVRETLKTVEVEKQVVVEKEVLQVVHVKDTQVVERWHREKTEEKKPDGTVLTREVEDRNIDTVVNEKENTVKIVEVEKQVVVEKEVLVEKIVTPELAQWHVCVLVGAKPRLLPTVSASVAVGAEVERRIVGPLFLGVWGMGTTDGIGVGGIRAGLEF